MLKIAGLPERDNKALITALMLTNISLAETDKKDDLCKGNVLY